MGMLTFTFSFKIMLAENTGKIRASTELHKILSNQSILITCWHCSLRLFCFLHHGADAFNQFSVCNGEEGETLQRMKATNSVSYSAQATEAATALAYKFSDNYHQFCYFLLSALESMQTLYPTTWNSQSSISTRTLSTSITRRTKSIINMYKHSKIFGEIEFWNYFSCDFITKIEFKE